MNNNINPPQKQLSSLLQYYQYGQFIDAENLAITISKNYPNHPFSWKVLGAVLGTTGRKSEAVDVNQRVVALSPQDADAHFNLGNTLRELGRLDEALASYLQAIALKSDFAQAHYNLGTKKQTNERRNEKEGKRTLGESNRRQLVPLLREPFMLVLSLHI